MQITAAVVREKFGAFAIDQLELTDPLPDEALVRIVAAWACCRPTCTVATVTTTCPILRFTATKAPEWSRRSARASRN